MRSLKLTAAILTAILILSCSSTYRSMSAEEKRAFLAELGADCRSAVGAHGSIHGVLLRLRVLVLSREGHERLEGSAEGSLDSPNMVLDLRIPQNQRYQQVVLDTAVSQYLAGELTTEETMQQIYDGWEEITEELGREEQLEAYRNTIGAQ